MPYQMIWIVPNRVLLTTFSGVVSQTELQGFIADIGAEFVKCEPPVYHISNSLEMEHVKFSFKALSEMVKTAKHLSKIKAQIDINYSRALNTFLASLGSQLIHIEAHTVPNLDEAVTLLKRIDGNLSFVPWEIPPELIAKTQPTATQPNA